MTKVPPDCEARKSFHRWLRYACARDWREGNFNAAEGESFLAAARARISPLTALRVVVWCLGKAGHQASMDRTGEHLVRSYSDIVAETAEEFFSGAPAASHYRRSKWPDFNRAKVLELTTHWQDEASFAAWEEDSPTIVSELTTQDVLSYFIRPGEFGCRGRQVYDFETLPLARFLLRAERFQFVVLNPMKGLEGKKKNGSPSAKCDDNIKCRRVIVIEFDAKKFGDLAGNREKFFSLQAALHRHLATIQPLALLLFSGNESLHGTYAVKGVPDERLILFMREAVSLGADRALWTPSQFTRMPGGTNRETHARQTIHYFNPEVLSQ